MFRMWGKVFRDNHLLCDRVVEDDRTETRTHKVFAALTELCRTFDLAEPIWLDANVAEFQRLGRTRFRQENFVEEITFDFLELQVLEE